MLVLHGSWIKGRYYLWEETVPDAGSVRSSVPRRPERSPFDAGKWNLGATVALIAKSSYKARASHARRMNISLPTVDGHPLPSRMALMPLEWSESKGKTTSGKWVVTALPLSYPEMASLFSICVSSENPYEYLMPKIAAGYDVIAMAALWRFAGAIVARQTVVPSVLGNRSRWIPVLDHADERRLLNFIAEIPESAAALEGSVPYEDYARSFFEDAVDLIVRESVSTVLTRLHATRGKFYEVHSAWLASLRSRNSLIRWGSPEDIADFAKVLEDWRSPVTGGVHGTIRLGFRIADPRNPDSPNPMWRLTPVIVGGERAINLSEKNLAVLSAAEKNQLLVSLGQASVLCPLLANDEVSLADAVPLDASEVNIFLCDTAPLLKAAGYGVFAPAWWTPARRSTAAGGGEYDNTRLRIRASASRFTSQGSGFFSLDTLVDVKWELVLGDLKLTKEDVQKILSSGKPLVRWNSRWVYADRVRLTNALAKLDELNAGPVSVRSLVHMSAGNAIASEGNIEIDISGIEKRGDFATLVAQLRKDIKLEEAEPPPGFSGTLRKYQLRGLSWLSFLSKWGFGACLADDMGLGKTIEAISLFLHLRANGDSAPVLVVCPMSIMTKWQREISKFAPGLKTWIFHGHDRPKGSRFARKVSEVDVVITSYQLLCMDFASVGDLHWGVAVLDEAQNIKNPDTRKSRLARKLSAKWHLAMTGTPVENSLGDLWAIMDFLNPGLLGGRSRFNEVFLHPIQMGTDPGARDTLRKITGPFILRRLKTDPEIVADMPPRIEEKVYCQLSKEQAELYSAELKDLSKLLSSASGATRRGNVLGLLTRLKQICNHPEHYFSHDAAENEMPDAKAISAERSGKLRRFDEILDDVLAAGECALVFTQYAVMGKMLQSHLRARLGYEVPFLHGGVSMRGRDEMVARFQRPDGPPVFILSIKAGGTGLDLTRANHVFHFDRWWNPAVENQATDRAHRIGQKKSVFIHTLICDGTLESRIDDLITGKRELARQIIGSGDSWLSKLSDEKLKEILSLSTSAVEEAEGDDE